MRAALTCSMYLPMRSMPVSRSTAQPAHLLLKRLRRARQRGAHVPQGAQPLLLAGDDVLRCVAAQQVTCYAHAAECALPCSWPG